MTNPRKILSLVLAFTLLIGIIFPVSSVYAESTEQEEQQNLTVATDEDLNAETTEEAAETVTDDSTENDFSNATETNTFISMSANSMIAHYDMSHSGSTLRDISGNGLDGTVYMPANTDPDYYFNSTGNKTTLNFDGTNHVELPRLDVSNNAMTISTLLYNDGVVNGRAFGFGQDSTKYFYMTPYTDTDDANSVRSGLAYSDSYGLQVEQSATVNSSQFNALRNYFLCTVVADSNSNTITVYINGEKKAEKTDLTFNLSDIISESAQTKFYLGKSLYPGDPLFEGKISDVKIFNYALTQSEVNNLAITNNQAIADSIFADLAKSMLGNNVDAQNLTSKLTLTSIYSNTAIAWESSNQAVINSSTGDINATAGTGEEIVLTASFAINGTDYSHDYKVKVSNNNALRGTLREVLSDADKVALDKEALNIPNASNIMGNITLPLKGENGSNITWVSNNTSVIRTEPILNADYDDMPGGIVTRGASDVSVKLTATIASGTEIDTKIFNLTVKKAPAPVQTEAYLFALFKGEYLSMGEQVYFATSQDGMFWKDLNNNDPVLTSNLGEQGIRDPFIARSHEGDKFYMIATDLKINNRGGNPWADCQVSGSQSIIIWESEDLVNWTAPRMVKIARDDAGCTWAPEFIYDEKTGEYVVFWASRIGEDNFGKQRMYSAKTRDFYTFTEPELYYEATNDVIDSTMIKAGDTVYRFTKNENTSGILMQKNSNILGNFTDVSAPFVEAQRGVEGPAIFRFNDDPDKYCLLLDNFGGKGYYPLITTDIASGVFVEPDQSTYSMPLSPRHGSVIPITLTEYNALQRKWDLTANPLQPVTPDPTGSQPIAWYKFYEQTDGTTVIDSSGRNNNATLYGSSAYINDDTMGTRVLNLNGTQGTYMQLPTGLLDKRNELTISMNAKVETDAGNYFTFTFGLSDMKHYFMKLMDSSIKSIITKNMWNAERGITTTSSDTGNLRGTWANIKVVITKGTMKVYRDGELIGENLSIDTAVTDLGEILKAYLGKSFYSLDGYFKGSFYDLKIYNYAMPPAQIAADVFYPVTIEQALNGSINTNKKLLTKGDSVTLTFTPNTGFELDTVYINGFEVRVVNNTFTVNNVSGAISVKALFMPTGGVAIDKPLIAHYLWNDTSTGTTVVDESGNGKNGLIRGNGGILENGVIYLPGGTKNTSNAYVELPTGMVDGKNYITVSVWLKNENPGGNYGAVYFGTTENFPSQYWQLNAKSPQGRMKSVMTNGLNPSAPWSTEAGIAAGPITDSNWALFTTVITPTTLTGYYNGVKVDTVPLSRTISQFGNNLVVYIGRSSYPDDLYKGSVKDLRFYDGALSDEQVWQVYNEEAVRAKLKQVHDNLSLGDNEFVISDLQLPTGGAYNSTISWASSNNLYITPDGRVNLPAKGQGDKQVSLTATISLKGQTRQKTFNFTVLENDPDKILNIIKHNLNLGLTKVITKNITLPSSPVAGATVQWSSSNTAVISNTGHVTRPLAGSGNSNVTLTARISYPGKTTTKQFSLTVLEAFYGEVFAYNEAGSPANIKSSIHYATRTGNADFERLNSGQGVIYSKLLSKAFKTPYLFRKEDGGFIITACDNEQTNVVHIVETDDLLTVKSETNVSLNELGIKVANPMVKYDSAIGLYRILWTGGNGLQYSNTTEDFETLSFPELYDYTVEAPTVTNITEASGGNIIGLTKAEYEKLVVRLKKVQNISVKPVSVSTIIGNAVVLPQETELLYSDNSSLKMPVVWNQDDVNAVNFNAVGTYRVRGQIQQKKYSNPFIMQRADPYIVRSDDGYYYFTASYPAFESVNNGYDKIILRRSATIEGLKDAQEVTIWNAHPSGIMSKHIWAPEMHYIGGSWYIFFAAGSSTDIWDIRACVLKCEGDGDPYKPQNWVEKGIFKTASGTDIGRFSLDMTYFENNGKHYVIWAQIVGDSSLFMAEINPQEPWKLINEPILLTKPEFGWELIAHNVNEGATVLKRDGKIFVAFSASGTGEEYCIGLLTASADADLMDVNSWEKTGYPVLSSSDVTGESGPGHNSFTVDENGNDIFVYHARVAGAAINGNPLYDPNRHARIKRVYWLADGTPYLKMTYENELLPELQEITATVTVSNIYTVTFKSNGGVQRDVTVRVTPPATTVGTLPAKPTKNGYVFKGWNTKEDGTGRGFNENTPVTQNMTVYAMWAVSTKSGSDNKGYNATDDTASKNASVNGQIFNIKEVDNEATLILSTNDLAKALASDSSELNVSVSNKDNLSVTLPLKDLSNVGVNISLSGAKLTMPSGAIKDINAKYGNSDLTVKVTGNPITVNVSVDGKPLSYSKGERPFKLRIAYAKSSNQNPNTVVIADKSNKSILPLSYYENGSITLNVGSSEEYEIIDNSKTFEDMQNHWSGAYVDFVTARELFQGSDGKFNPDGTMTRAMFATVLSRLDSVDVSKYNHSRFSDVSPNLWYTGAVEWAADQGLFGGVGDNKFDPNAPITREQMASIVYKYMKLKGNETNSTGNSNRFTDEATISPWAAEAVKAVQNAGIIVGSTDNNFNPKKTATRGEVATVFTKLIKSLLS